MYVWDWNIIWDHKEVFLRGALTTMGLTFLVVILGTALGIGLALLKRNEDLIIRRITGWFIDLFRALPILILLIWLYYVTPTVLPWRLSPFIAALIALSVNLSAFVAETVHAGIAAIPKQQFESARVLGLSEWQIMVRIIFPQAFRNILPNLMGHYVTQLKNSSLASVIAVNEVLHEANMLISNTFRPLEIYTAVAVTYLILILPCTALAHIVEKRLAKHV